MAAPWLCPKGSTRKFQRIVYAVPKIPPFPSAFFTPDRRAHMQEPHTGLHGSARKPSMPQLKDEKPPKIEASPTRTCEWCAESIPEQALVCPRCCKWRKDIEEDRRNYITALVSTLVIGVLCAAFFLCALTYSSESSGTTSITGFPGLILILIAVILIIGESRIRRAKNNLKQKIGSDWRSVLPDWLSFLSS